MHDDLQIQWVTARRNQILDAAANVFAQKGFHATTIKDIARAAGIADGTIYNYFANKPALLIGMFDRMRDTLQPSLPNVPPEDTDMRGAIVMLLRHPLMALQDDNFELFRVVMSEMMVNNELRTLYAEHILQPTLMMAEGVLYQWAAQGRLDADQIPMLTRILSSVVMGLMLQYVIGDETLKAGWDELPERIADMVMRGITR